jgi:hypothetical protein
VELTAQSIHRYLRSGLLIQLVSPRQRVFAEVLSSSPARVTARFEGGFVHPERVLVRAPIKDALFQASARVSPDDTAGNILNLEGFTNMLCTERREFARLDDPVPARVFRDSDGGAYHQIAAVNLGANGLLLGWEDAPDVTLGERIRLRVALDDAFVAAVGEVVRLDGCRTAVRFTNISEQDQDRIASYIFRQEARA